MQLEAVALPCRKFPDKTHSLVWTHKSGRKSRVIGCHASPIVA